MPSSPGSARAKAILADWDSYLPKFKKVMPIEYRRALSELISEVEDEPPLDGARGGVAMGKVTGFLEIDRRDRRYAPASDRIRHYKEFVIPLTERGDARAGARCMDCGIPYCHNGCPVNNQIPDWNDLVYRGKWQEAARNLHSTNNFPEFTGRICPAPCEASCTLNLDDPPVTIKTIECAIADKAWAEGWIKPEPAKQKTGKTVAVIGSGPAGLACAQQLARAGHDVHVYEKNQKPGGLLRYGIPDFKLEKRHIDRRVEQMKAEGVTFHTRRPRRRRRAGCRSRSPKYDAVVLAGGAEKAARSADPRPRAAGRAFRHGLPAAAEPARDEGAAQDQQSDPRARQACASSSAAATRAPTASARRSARARFR